MRYGVCMKSENLVTAFQKLFGSEPSSTYFSPGRVNLIGEYTDFNGGYVLPAAINLGTYYAVGLNTTNRVNVYSDGADGLVSINLTDIADQILNQDWSDYVKGSLVEYHKSALVGEHGVDIYISGDLPRNSGLSSSASLTVGLVFLLNNIWDCNLDRLDIAKMSRSVENDFIGLQCGIMDQFAVAKGQTDHAVCLHCHTLESKLIPFQLDGYEIVITDSRVPRKLSESSYNQRRGECDAALATLQKDLSIDYLCEASVQDVEKCEELRANPIAYKRAKHVVTENSRVLAAVKCLSQNRLAEFGELLYASHNSLRDDFEVSCKELDILVETTKNIAGVLGSRMTGAGFGGCILSLVATSVVPEFIQQLSAAYAAHTSYQATIHCCQIGDGVKQLNN
jgi:galactokinase